MNRCFVIVVLVCVCTACDRPVAPQRAATPKDAIDRLMTQVPFEFCPSYMYVPVDLPTNAAPTKVIAALAKRGEFGVLRISRFQTLEIRNVRSLQEGAESFHYSAALLDTDLGQMILLLSPETGGWYYKFYDAK